MASNCRSDDAVTNDRETTSFVSRDETPRPSTRCGRGPFKIPGRKVASSVRRQIFLPLVAISRTRARFYFSTKNVPRLLSPQRTILHCWSIKKLFLFGGVTYVLILRIFIFFSNMNTNSKSRITHIWDSFC